VNAVQGAFLAAAVRYASVATGLRERRIHGRARTGRVGAVALTALPGFLPLTCHFRKPCSLSLSPSLLGLARCPDCRGPRVASALVNTTQQVGGLLGTALLNSIAASATVHYLGAHGAGSLSAATVHGYTVAFTWGLGALILAVVLSLVLVTKATGPGSQQQRRHRLRTRRRTSEQASNQSAG
jgi:hypothetical protein